MMRPFARLALLALSSLLAAAASARAQPASGFLPSASAARPPGAAERTGHAWFVAPVQAAGDKLRREFALLHVPPRDERGLVAPGSVRVAARFNAMPEGLAAFEGRVYVVFGRETRAGVQTASEFSAAPVVQRRVVSVRAAPTVAGGHEYLPPGTVEACAALPGAGLLTDVVACPAGLFALLRPDEFAQGRWELLRMGVAGWLPEPLPTPRPFGPGTWARLVGVGASLWCVHGEGDVVEAVQVLRAPSATEPPAGDAPTPAGLAWGALAASEAPAGISLRAAHLLSADGLLLALVRAGEGVAVVRIGAGAGGLGAAQTLAQVDLGRASGDALAGVALDGLGRVLLAWAEAVPPAVQDTGQQRETVSTRPPPAATRVQVREVSLWTGEVLHAGPAKREGVLTSRDFQVLTFVVGGIMLAVMAFVLRSDAHQTLSLPTGVALAGPGGRALAALIDLAAPVALACLLTGSSPRSLVGWHLLVGSSFEAWHPLLLAWTLTVALGAGQEWLTGRTLGKRLVGFEVLGLHRDPGPEIEGARFGSVVIGRPTLWQATLRNLVCRGVPPLGILLLFDANWRHAGDLLAGTVVVIPPEKPEA